MKALIMFQKVEINFLQDLQEFIINKFGIRLIIYVSKKNNLAFTKV